jgi:spermidine synthase
MALAQDVVETGRQVATVGAGTLSAALRAGIERYVDRPYKVASASVVDVDGAVSDVQVAYFPDTPGRRDEF